MNVDSDVRRELVSSYSSITGYNMKEAIEAFGEKTFARYLSGSL